MMLFAFLASVVLATNSTAAGGPLIGVDKLTNQNDRARTGWNANEKVLTPRNVAGGAFRPLWQSPELRFRPNNQARAIRTGESRTIGLIPDLRNPFFPELVKAHRCLAVQWLCYARWASAIPAGTNAIPPLLASAPWPDAAMRRAAATLCRCAAQHLTHWLPAPLPPRSWPACPRVSYAAPLQAKMTSSRGGRAAFEIDFKCHDIARHWLRRFPLGVSHSEFLRR
jgi:hypothetical protein